MVAHGHDLILIEGASTDCISIASPIRGMAHSLSRVRFKRWALRVLTGPANNGQIARAPDLLVTWPYPRIPLIRGRDISRLGSPQDLLLGDLILKGSARDRVRIRSGVWSPIVDPSLWLVVSQIAHDKEDYLEVTCSL